MPDKAKFYANSVIAGGSLVLADAVWNWASPNPRRFFIYLALTLLASIWKFRVPGIPGTYSASFLLTLVGLVAFTLPETVVAGCVGAIAQSVWKPKQRPSMIQVLFSMANLVLSISLCFLVAHATSGSGLAACHPAMLALLAAVHFFTSTMLLSGVLSLLQGKRLRVICQQWYVWYLPYYLIGAALVGLLPLPGYGPKPEGWFILLPLLYLVHFYYLVARTRPFSTDNNEEKGQHLRPSAQLYMDFVIAVGGALLIYAALHWECSDVNRFLGYLTMALLAATLKVRLPGLTSTISAAFVLVLVAIAELTYAETISLTIAATVVQIVWRPKRTPRLIPVAFNCACMVISVSIAFTVCRIFLVPTQVPALPMLLATATALLYGTNVFMVAVVMCLAERKPLGGLWQQCYFWSFPYYVVGASVSGLMIAAARSTGWPFSLAIFPVLALVYTSYRIHTTMQNGFEAAH